MIQPTKTYKHPKSWNIAIMNKDGTYDLQGGDWMSVSLQTIEYFWFLPEEKVMWEQEKAYDWITEVINDLYKKGWRFWTQLKDITEFR